MHNDDSLTTQFYFIIIYREYHKNDPHAITSPNVNEGGKGGQKGKKVHEFHFRIKIDLHYYFHAT